MCEKYKRSAPGRDVILAWAIALAKMVAVSESCKIARVAYLGQISIIKGGRARKL